MKELLLGIITESRKELPASAIVNLHRKDDHWIIEVWLEKIVMSINVHTVGVEDYEVTTCLAQAYEKSNADSIITIPLELLIVLDLLSECYQVKYCNSDKVITDYVGVIGESESPFKNLLKAFACMAESIDDCNIMTNSDTIRSLLPLMNQLIKVIENFKYSSSLCYPNWFKKVLCTVYEEEELGNILGSQ